MLPPVRAALACLCCSLISYDSVSCQRTDPNESLERVVSQFQSEGLLHISICTTRQGDSVEMLLDRRMLDPRSDCHQVLLVGGVTGNSVEVIQLLKQFQRMRGSASDMKIAISIIPCINPERFSTGEPAVENRSGGQPAFGFPAEEKQYFHSTDPESVATWQWLQEYPPDSLVVVYPDAVFKSTKWSPVLEANRSLSAMVQGIKTHAVREGEDIDLNAVLQDGYSQKRSEMRKRLKRTPELLAEDLLQHYGHDFPSVQYIATVALMGKLHLAQLSGRKNWIDEVAAVCAPYVDGNKESLPRPTGVAFAGHLAFGALHEQRPNDQLVALVVKAAEHGFKSNGLFKESMPDHHQMSDSVFMGAPILTRAGRLTGEPRYFEMAWKHVEFVRQLCLRDDGLYRHWPGDETAWGRGNGFPALGMALCLSDIPKQHPLRETFLSAYRQHMDTLVRHQDPTGAWRQAIDHRGAYREFTATCMITFAILRGMREGWLEEKRYAPIVQRSWREIVRRIGSHGKLNDVCTGTGKQADLRAYLDRKAIQGKDARGGAMALIVTAEWIAWRRSRDKQ